MGLKNLFTIAAFAVSTLCSTNATAQTQKTLFDSPFTSDYNASMPYRIPAIVKTGNGDILAFADKRHGGGDVGQYQNSSSAVNAHIDLVYKRSTDNGANWGEEKTIVKGSENMGYGDIAVVADSDNPNNIVLFCAAGNTFCFKSKKPSGTDVSNTLRCFRFRSTDGGQTWNTGEDVTIDIYSLFSDYTKTYTGAFFSSGRICQSKQIKVGSHYRLYAALAMVTYNSGWQYSTIVIYSDDFGANWSVLGGSGTVAVEGGNEAKVEELPNGNLLVSSRAAGRYFNVFTYTNQTTGAGSWGTLQHALTSYDKGETNGEILLVPAKDKKGNVCNVLLQSLPIGSGRTKVGIVWKEISDDANTSYSSSSFNSGWSTSPYYLSQQTSAYSTMILQGDNNIGFLYEDYLDASLGTGGYDIKYVNLPLSTITNGAYTYYKEETVVETVSTPVISLASGEVESGTKVTITCETDGATIYYTTDGTTPSATNGTAYTGAITITEAMTLKAVAVKTGYNDSEVASATYTIKATVVETVSTPAISLASGEVESGTKVTITCGTSGATIYYTTDGTTPSATNGTAYTGAITITKAMTLKAVAVKTGYNASEVASATYTIKTATDEGEDNEGTGGDGEEGGDNEGTGGDDNTPTTVTKYRFKNVHKNGTIFYFAYNATDGLTLTTSESEAYLYTRTTVDEANGVYNFKSEDGNYLIFTGRNISSGSNIGQNSGLGYLTEYDANFCDLTIAKLTTSTYVESFTGDYYTIKGGRYTTNQWGSSLGVTYAYFVIENNGDFDGASDPFYDDTFSSAFVIEEVVETIGGGETPVVETVSTPSISLASGEVESGTKVEITCETDGATIYYTTDGTTPSATNGTAYTGAITITEAMTLKAVAVKEGWNDSEVAEATYTIKATTGGVQVEGNRIIVTVKGRDCTSGTCSQGLWSSLYLDCAVNLPSGVKAYRATEDRNGEIVLRKLTRTTIPAHYGVIIIDPRRRTELVLTKTSKGFNHGTNILKGTLERIDITEENRSNYYVIGHTSSNHSGFYHLAVGGYIGANKAFIYEANGAEIKFRFEEEDATGIEDIFTEEEDNAPVYDLTGRRVTDYSKPGIYIKNGKKFLVK